MGDHVIESPSQSAKLVCDCCSYSGDFAMAKRAAIAICFLLLEPALALSCRMTSAAVCGIPSELSRLFDSVMAGESTNGGCVSSSLSPPLASEIPNIKVISAPVWDHKNNDLLEVISKCMASSLCPVD